MAINASPRKQVPLSSGDDYEPRPKLISLSSGPAITKRAFFCGVVVEGPNDGEDLSDDIQDLVASLGDRLTTDFESSNSSQSISLSPAENVARKEGKTNANAFSNLLEELVSSEENYMKRLRILKTSYADPLRSYARNKETAIIPGYVANTLFGNIDQIVPANEAFLRDLQQMMTPEGSRTVGGVGDVALHHFKTLKAFECYKKYYVKREEAQMLFKQEMAKKSTTGFAVFEERIQYATNDSKNRVGLRELMMEPVQRIPRYTLLFRSMMKVMDLRDPQRTKLAEADEIASKIALAETDDHTRLAATLNCLASSIEGFPPDLIKSTRRFIDCIDVEDNISDGLGMGAGSNPYASVSSSSASVNSGSSGTLHCTLILFDDKLMIVRRPNGDKPGRVLAGLDDAEKFASGGFLKSFMKKNSMICKGVFDVTDVSATDVSGPDMHFYFESPPYEQGERWSGRPLRVYSVVHPPVAVNQDPIRTSNDKRRFLENLWRVQARFRTKMGQSVALCGEDMEIENRAGRLTMARTYFNVYQRTLFLKEAKKTKIVLHIDSLGTADPLPFGLGEAPYVVVRVHPMQGDLARYTVMSSDPDDESEQDILPTCRVPEKIVQTIHQYGLFKFRSTNLSRPATPTSSRSRAHIFGLEVLSRNLFGALPGGKSERDVFGNGDSLNGSHRRSRSGISRSSTTTTTTTTDSSMKFSARSNSTAATSVSYRSSVVMDEDSFGERLNSPSKPNRKLVKRNRSRSRSPGATLGADDYEMDRNSSLKRSRSNSTTAMDYSAYEEHGSDDFRAKRVVSQSERDLTRQLEIARQNSLKQHNRDIARGVVEMPVEETIYEEEPPLPVRPLSRASRSTTRHDRDGASLRSNTPPTTRSITPTLRSPSPVKGGPRSPSLLSNERRPMGPRPPSPLPPLSPSMQPSYAPSMTGHSPMDIERALDATLAGLERPPRTPSRTSDERHLDDDPPSPSPLPRSKRQPFNPTGNTDAILKNSNKAIEPLSIKKKTSNAGASPTKAQYGTPSTVRRQAMKNSPLTRVSSSKIQTAVSSPPRKASPQVEGISDEAKTRLITLAESTKEDLESSKRAVKRIRLELKSRPSQSSASSNARSPARATPTTPTRSAAATSEAHARMEEMRVLLGQRNGAAAARNKFKGGLETSASLSSIDSSSSLTDAWAKSVDDTVSSAEANLESATKNCELLAGGIKHLAAVGGDSADVEKCRTELRSTKRQCDLLKNLLNDATAENEIMYQAFNEELDGMFNDANLPDGEAWSSMTTDLRKAKEDRNRLTQENAQLKRKMKEIEMQRDEWAILLREHGLIP